MGSSDFQLFSHTRMMICQVVFKRTSTSPISVLIKTETLIPILKQALSINSSLRILVTPLTAPAWMKQSHKLFGGKINTDTRYLTVLAEYFVKFIEAYDAEGIPIDALSVQNEPLLSRNDDPTMTIHAGTQQAFIRDHLGPLLRRTRGPLVL